MTSEIWLVLCRSPGSPEWRTCAHARSAAAAHERVGMLKESAARLGIMPASWLVATASASRLIARHCGISTRNWDL